MAKQTSANSSQLPYIRDLKNGICFVKNAPGNKSAGHFILKVSCDDILKAFD